MSVRRKGPETPEQVCASTSTSDDDATTTKAAAADGGSFMVGRGEEVCASVAGVRVDQS